jgi:putative tryptophan/tyrosine transport system substrate-binding protein
MQNMDRRRMLLTSLAASGAVSIFGELLNAAELPRLGILHPGPKGPIPSVDAVISGLGDQGYVDGKTVLLEYRYGDNKPDQLPELARGLADQNVKVIVAVAGDALLAAAKVTKTVPIVSATGGGDFVVLGLIKDYNHPGTNVTGMNLVADQAAAARIEILRVAIPAIKKITVLADLAYPGNENLLAVMRSTAEAAKITLDTREVAKKEDVEDAVVSAKRDGTQAIAAIQGPFYFFQRELLAAICLKHQIPLAAGEYGSAKAGAFVQVNPDIVGCARKCGGVVDAILKGARPDEIKVERWDKYDVVFSQRAMKALDLEISPDLIKHSTIVE